VAIGNALALEGAMTVTRRIVSATTRQPDTGTGTMMRPIQTHGAITSDSSGGPLGTAAGQVIGINRAVATSSRAASVSNIRFAIISDTARSVVERLTGK
jgi:S1-C subfamily serine protease